MHDNGLAVVGYASRSLKDHEANYTPFLAEQAAAVLVIKHFAHRLIGRHFTLDMDHKPMERLTDRQTKTLHRLQELIGCFSFHVKHVDGKDNILPDFAFMHPHAKTIANIASKDYNSLQSGDPKGNLGHPP